MQAAGRGGGKAMPLDMPQGKKQRLPKSLARTLKLLWELLCWVFFRRGEWKLCLIKRHPNIGTSPQMVLPPLALIFGEYNCDEVLECTHKFEGGWLSASTNFITIVRTWVSSEQARALWALMKWGNREDVFKSAPAVAGLRECVRTHEYTCTHAHTQCFGWGAVLLFVFFFLSLRMSGKDTFFPCLPPPLPGCFTFKDDLFY